MTKQPDPSRSSVPRPGSALPSPLGGNSAQPPAPMVPGLPTIKPTSRQSRANSTVQLDPVTLRRESDARKPGPFDLIGQSSKAVDATDVQVAISGDISDENEHESMTIRDRIEKNRHPYSSMLISIVAHLAILLTLSFLVVGWEKPLRSIGIIATIDSTPVPEVPSDAEAITIEINSPAENESPVEMELTDTAPKESVDVAESIEIAVNPVTNDVQPNPNENKTEPVRNALLPTGGGLEGRIPAARARLAAQEGGTRESEMAVELGLKWILAHQRTDGSWHFKHDGGNCDGDCNHEGLQESTTAATGLALMSLLGAGYTHRSGPYQEQVQKGLDYLVSKMRVTRHGGNLCQGESGMYSHAIATIALSEASTMTGDTDLFQAVILARKYIESAQHKLGGWRYVPGNKGDMTVTGWQLMALKSCDMCGAVTGRVTYELAEEFVDSLQSSSGCFGYQAPDENPTTTAVGILSKMYLGASLDNNTLQQGTDFVADIGPSSNDVYFNYYATQVLHHRHDRSWPKWNKQMRDHLIGTQDHSDTHQAGSWYFPDKHGQVGGRLYTTAMSVMILEVYYRYLPLYDKDAIN